MNLNVHVASTRLQRLLTARKEAVCWNKTRVECFDAASANVRMLFGAAVVALFAKAHRVRLLS